MLKLSYPQLGIGTSTQQAYSPSDMIQSAIPVVDSVCHSARLITSSSGSLPFLGPLVPTLAHSVFLAAKVLIVFGGTLVQGSENVGKIQLLRNCLQVLAKRWKIAGGFCAPRPRRPR